MMATAGVIALTILGQALRAESPVIFVTSQSAVAQDQAQTQEAPPDFDLGIEDEPRTLQRSSGSIDRGMPQSFCPEDGVIISKPIVEVSASIAVKEKQVPEDCSTNVFQGRQMATARTMDLVQFHWRPTNFFHQPLYFDDTPLERYGQSICPCVQPAISGARFFGTLAIVPYKIGIDRTHDCVSTLAYYRPGNCNPCIRERLVPALEWDASLLEAGTALALVFALP
jgi:hypothetical protein